jgi:excisionase family DNA binding protein
MTDRASRPSPRLTLNAASPMIGPSTRGGLVGKLRTIDEFADLWGVSPRTIQRLIRSHALRAHRIGRLVRISDADAAAFLTENCDD